MIIVNKDKVIQVQKIILMVRKLRSMVLFKMSVRMLVIFLMVLGSWVATISLEFPAALDVNDYLKHIIVFFGFSVLMDLTTSRHPFLLWKGLPLLIYGFMIEVMQYYSPDRVFSVLDWLADLSGILLYFVIKNLMVKLGSNH